MRRTITTMLLLSFILIGCGNPYNMRSCVEAGVECEYIVDVSVIPVPDDNVMESLYSTFGVHSLRTVVIDRILLVLQEYTKGCEFQSESEFYGFYKSINEWSPSVVQDSSKGCTSVEILPGNGVIRIAVNKELITTVGLAWVTKATGEVDVALTNEDIESIEIPDEFDWRMDCTSRNDFKVTVQEELFIRKFVYSYRGYMNGYSDKVEAVKSFNKAVGKWSEDFTKYGIIGSEFTDEELSVTFASGLSLLFTVSGTDINIALMLSV